MILFCPPSLPLTLFNADSLFLGIPNPDSSGQTNPDFGLDVQVDDSTSTANEVQEPDGEDEELEVGIEIDF